MEKAIHISFDDVEICLKNLACNDYKSLFDEPLFVFLKFMHESFGARFSLYVFADCLTEVPDKYKEEFSNASDWLKFGLHAESRSSSFKDCDYSTAKATWNRFVDELLRFAGSPECIDRCPRLHFFAGSREALTGMKDGMYGARGFLAADDDRLSYFLDAAQNQILREQSYYFDKASGLKFCRTDFRTDKLKEMPVKSNAYDELSYNFLNFSRIVLFCHEYQIHDGSKLNKNKAWIEDACRFARDYNYKFCK